MAEIEIKAMVNAGISEDIATGWVIKALEDLKEKGVTIIKIFLGMELIIKIL